MSRTIKQTCIGDDCALGKTEGSENLYCGWGEPPEDDGPMFLFGCQECADGHRVVFPGADVWPPATARQGEKA